MRFNKLMMMMMMMTCNQAWRSGRRASSSRHAWLERVYGWI